MKKPKVFTKQNTKTNEYGIKTGSELLRAAVDYITYQLGDPKEEVYYPALNFTEGKCFYCGCELLNYNENDGVYYARTAKKGRTKGKSILNWDHLYPASHLNLLVNGNCVPACYDCNRKKSDKLPEDFYDELTEQRSPLLYETKEDFMVKVNELSSIYRVKYNDFYKFSKRKAKGDVSKAEFAFRLVGLLQQALLKPGTYSNWTKANYHTHVNSALWEEFISSFPDKGSSIASARKLAEIISRDQRPVREQESEIIVSKIRDFYQLRVTELTDPDSIASLKRVIRSYLDYFWDKNVFDSLKDSLYNNYEFHFDKNLWEEFISSQGKCNQTRATDARKIATEFCKNDKSIFRYSPQEIFSVMDEIIGDEEDKKETSIGGVFADLVNVLDIPTLSFAVIKHYYGKSWALNVHPYTEYWDSIYKQSNSVMRKFELTRLSVYFKTDVYDLSSDELVSKLKEFYVKEDSIPNVNKDNYIRLITHSLNFNPAKILLKVSDECKLKWDDVITLVNEEDKILYSTVSTFYPEGSATYKVLPSIFKQIALFIYYNTGSNTFNELNEPKFNRLLASQNSTGKAVLRRMLAITTSVEEETL